MKKVLIIINVSKDESVKIAEEISSFLKEKQYETVFYSFAGFCNRAPFSEFDFVISLGGDGTVLFAARNSVEYGIPIFPVNLGQFGFIAAIQPDEWKTELEKFLDGKSQIKERMMVTVEINRRGTVVFSQLGLNDVVVSSAKGATTVNLNAMYDELPLCRLISDGVIISTPTGSTAYSAAAGGPIIDPELDAMILTPVNSFSLSSRPLVLSTEGKLKISVEKSRNRDVFLRVDGQEPEELLFGDEIIIRKYEKKVRLVSCTRENFYNALRSKLNWTGGPYA